ncbi:hypothetical protein T439DRAFT_381783, partial [Meredithblackwellia eburnea MCA 4105]
MPPFGRQSHKFNGSHPYGRHQESTITDRAVLEIPDGAKEWQSYQEGPALTADMEKEFEKAAFHVLVGDLMKHEHDLEWWRSRGEREWHWSLPRGFDKQAVERGSLNETFTSLVCQLKDQFSLSDDKSVPWSVTKLLQIRAERLFEEETNYDNPFEYGGGGIFSGLRFLWWKKFRSTSTFRSPSIPRWLLIEEKAYIYERLAFNVVFAEIETNQEHILQGFKFTCSNEGFGFSKSPEGKILQARSNVKVREQSAFFFHVVEMIFAFEHEVKFQSSPHPTAHEFLAHASLKLRKQMDCLFKIDADLTAEQALMLVWKLWFPSAKEYNGKKLQDKELMDPLHASALSIFILPWFKLSGEVTPANLEAYRRQLAFQLLKEMSLSFGDQSDTVRERAQTLGKYVGELRNEVSKLFRAELTSEAISDGQTISVEQGIKSPQKLLTYVETVLRNATWAKHFNTATPGCLQLLRKSAQNERERAAQEAAAGSSSHQQRSSSQQHQLERSLGHSSVYYPQRRRH